MNLQLLEDTERFLLRYGLIHFPKLPKEENRFKDLKRFYINFYKVLNRNTSEPIGGPKDTDIPSDYKTYPYRDRSFRDIFLICRYYTDCSLKEFLEITADEGVVGMVCTTIDKYLLFPLSVYIHFRLYNQDEKREELNNLSISELYATIDRDIVEELKAKKL